MILIHQWSILMERGAYRCWNKRSSAKTNIGSVTVLNRQWHNISADMGLPWILQDTLGSLSLTEPMGTNTEIQARINKYINIKQCDVINHPFHMKPLMILIIRDLISVYPCSSKRPWLGRLEIHMTSRLIWSNVCMLLRPIKRYIKYIYIYISQCVY